MTWVRLDDRFHENRKIKRVWRRCPEALGLYVMALAYSADHGLNGFVDVDFVEERLPREKDRQRATNLLVDVGLWEQRDDGWLIHDFLEFNPSSEQIAAGKRAKSEAGKKGAEARWRHPHSKADAMTTATASAMPADTAESMAKNAPVPVPTTTPPNPPKGGRQRDRRAFNEECESYGADRFPELAKVRSAFGGASKAGEAVRQAVESGCRTDEQVRAHVEHWFMGDAA